MSRANSLTFKRGRLPMVAISAERVRRCDSSFVQECRDVLGDRAVHCWGVVATGQEQSLQLAGLKLQHVR